MVYLLIFWKSYLFCETDLFYEISRFKIQMSQLFAFTRVNFSEIELQVSTHSAIGQPVRYYFEDIYVINRLRKEFVLRVEVCCKGIALFYLSLHLVLQLV